ncbi:efflux transporter outer membrane subunit [Opitutus sp. GAS368]|uniref:efflux transporter outer membrane subunit n=1 Tax=Opitutus sp. GAS368 TaxID=1882749 RepID=UPI0008796E5F|nr:efflux transporter outer membrane subunit [Opitutus sp. GAS368]SDS10415.1 outer membrane protein, multidrug efflux system [Opitutus sp. GAS368]
MKPTLFLLALTSPVFAALPSVGPDYQRPVVESPVAWKQAAAATALPRGEWWKTFNDATLDDLETRALNANQDLHAAAARVEQARAAAGIARSNYLPSVGLNPSVGRARTSETTDNRFPVAESTTYRASLDASWELDLFGRVRRLSEGARAEATASADDFENVRLALTAEVASSYFSLRALDRETALVNDGVGLRRKTLELINSRRTNGAATDFDVARAETELASTEADAAALANRRAALQNALAVLLGEAAPSYELSAISGQLSAPPPVPVGLPSELLERRPDIAAAESALAAANARIGVAKAAFFPAISLTGSFGYASSDISRLANSDSKLWSIGPSLYLPIFQGGRNRANLARSRAAYEESVALFRQRVLVAFREVQDALTATQLLADQAAAQARAVAAARRAGELAQTRYDAGYVNYFEVIDAQRTLLTAERAATQLGAQQLVNSVGLIKALGGGWSHGPSVVAAN